MKSKICFNITDQRGKDTSTAFFGITETGSGNFHLYVMPIAIIPQVFGDLFIGDNELPGWTTSQYSFQANHGNMTCCRKIQIIIMKNILHNQNRIQKNVSLKNHPNLK